ncbi:hypothetical protein AU198_12860 [Mycobacterium sp. GA-1199]|nr:hypothetical protein AU198_12860 [Mycobacterium sp. GA-1199]
MSHPRCQDRSVFAKRSRCDKLAEPFPVTGRQSAPGLVTQRRADVGFMLALIAAGADVPRRDSAVQGVRSRIQLRDHREALLITDHR